jgi:tRNA-specific 2-thiouridylase
MKKVVIAMSGGVDSSVAAALLQEQGYQVSGMMLRLWSEPGKEDSNRCCTPDSMSQARRVAARLGIPFHVIDAKELFRNTVVQYFLESYARAETPNPCLLCNRQIRWEYLFQHAIAIGADYMATGHYVRKRQTPNGTYELLRGIDPAKDQSYVLHVLTQQKLAQALFPIGEYPKTEIRAIAARLGLSVAQRPDSQDLCFLAGEDYRNFLRRNAPQTLQPGPILDETGKEIGRHEGLANYTIGQRKGLGIASPVPLYVLAKQAGQNALVVGSAESLGSRNLTATEINWLAGSPPPGGAFRAHIKTRYTAQQAPGLVIPSADGRQAQVQFDAPQRDITPGQAAVFYEGESVLGGGIIRPV